MKALINTKSNYNNLNGQWLEVKELQGNRVTCIAWSDEFNKFINVDFVLTEIKEFNNNK